MAGPKCSTAFTFKMELYDSDGDPVSSPTIAEGDFKLNGTNTTNTPTASGTVVTVVLTADEAPTTPENKLLSFADAAGDEWAAGAFMLLYDDVTLGDVPTAAEINAQVDTALSDYDGPTATEMTNAFTALQGADGDTLETLSDQIDTIDLSGVADAVWVDATTRTLTSTAAETVDALNGSDLTVTAAVSFDATLSGLTIPATWEKVIFTAKSSKSLPDTASWMQIVETNPGAGTDGLLYLNGAAGTAADGSLTVDQAAGTIVIHIADDATAEFTRALSGGYDIKCLTSDDESEQLTLGTFTVQLTETKALT